MKVHGEIISMEENAADFIYLANTGLCFSLCINVTKCPNLCEMSHTELATWKFQQCIKD